MLPSKLPLACHIYQLGFALLVISVNEHLLLCHILIKFIGFSLVTHGCLNKLETRSFGTLSSSLRPSSGLVKAPHRLCEHNSSQVSLQTLLFALPFQQRLLPSFPRVPPLKSDPLSHYKKLKSITRPIVIYMCKLGHFFFAR